MTNRAGRRAAATRSAIAALIGLLGSPAAPAQDRAEGSAANFRILDAIDPCNFSPADDEILVCGSRRERSPYRIPRLGRGNNVLGVGNVRGEVPRASAEAVISGGCGIFQGQRRCSEAEMAEAGYGAGRDPVTFLANLFTRLADPDADIGSPPTIPDPPGS